MLKHLVIISSLIIPSVTYSSPSTLTEIATFEFICGSNKFVEFEKLLYETTPDEEIKKYNADNLAFTEDFEKSLKVISDRGCAGLGRIIAMKENSKRLAK